MGQPVTSHNYNLHKAVGNIWGLFCLGYVRYSSRWDLVILRRLCYVKNLIRNQVCTPAKTNQPKNKTKTLGHNDAEDLHNSHNLKNMSSNLGNQLKWSLAGESTWTNWPCISWTWFPSPKGPYTGGGQAKESSPMLLVFCFSVAWIMEQGTLMMQSTDSMENSWENRATSAFDMCTCLQGCIVPVIRAHVQKHEPARTLGTSTGSEGTDRPMHLGYKIYMAGGGARAVGTVFFGTIFKFSN